MPSLKEVKTRIASVNSTRKITSAMKMVASSKLHRAQQAIERMRPYERQLGRIMATFVCNMSGELDSPFAGKREVRRVALVLYTSNSSLCGGFNANAVKAFHRKVEDYRRRGVEVARVYPIGRKAAEAAGKAGFAGFPDYSSLLDHPSYTATAAVAEEIMRLYAGGEIDAADMVYHHFKSAGTQVLTEEAFLPVSLEGVKERQAASPAGREEKGGVQLDFIIEPSVGEVVRQLIPKSLHLKLFTALLDSLASEHAARVVAMQMATDNADDLLRELTLTYNKTRQQAITSELLDIVGGSVQK